MANKSLLKKMRSVFNIARSRGFTHDESEDIAQDAAVLSIKGRDIRYQKNYYTFVDALREGSQKVRVFKGIKIDEGILSKYPIESNEDELRERASEVFDLVHGISKLDRDLIPYVLLYIYYEYPVELIASLHKMGRDNVYLKINKAIYSIKELVKGS